jgi:hypothetical protein
LGKEIKTFIHQFKSNYLYTESISDLSNGLYILELNGSKTSLKQKFLKQ